MNTYNVGTSPVSLAREGNFEAAVAMIEDPFHDLTVADMATCVNEIGAHISIEAAGAVAAMIVGNKIQAFGLEAPSWDGSKGWLPLWDLTTNRKVGHSPFMGIGKAAKAAAHRYLRREGWVFFLALLAWDEDGRTVRATRWGLCHKADLPEEDVCELVTGYTLSHCFHKLGAGSATRGGKTYWGW